MDTCGCGCGEPTRIATRNDPRRGYIKGQPVRFIRGHQLKVSQPWWTGDEVGYNALHAYLRKHYPKSGLCGQCGAQERTEYALIHGRSYSRAREDYLELCKKCHNAYDMTKDRGTPPLCKCGCGERVTWYASKYRWHAYTSGHYSVAAENKSRVGAGSN